MTPSPTSGAAKPQRGHFALRVRPMPGLALLASVCLAGAASADPNPASGWQAKGRRAKPVVSAAQIAERVDTVDGVRRVTLNAPAKDRAADAKTSLSWRRPTISKNDSGNDLGPKLLAPAVVKNARRVSAEAEIDAPELNPASPVEVETAAQEEGLEDWGQDVIDAQRVATRPFQEQAMPPLDQPTDSAPPLENESTPPVERETIEEPRRLSPSTPEPQRQIAQLPPCPRPEDLRKISEITDDITPPGTEFPPECELGHRVFEPRSWAEITYTWKASGLCHKPLYFEDVQLERYGHTCGPLLQPFASGAHFFGNALILPYKMGMEPPCECVYALGYYRPGDCAPFMIQPLGLSWQGAFWQGATVTGLVFLIP